MSKDSIREKIMLVFLCGLSYFLLDAPVQLTGVLPSFAGIKNFLPFTLGLFFGIWGVTGCITGCILSGLIVNPNVSALAYECICIALTGLGMFWCWHKLFKLQKISFKTSRDLMHYIIPLAVFSGLCFNIPVSLAYFLTGLFIGVPVNILFSSILYIDPVMPHGSRCEYDAEFCILSGAESLEEVNDIIEATSGKHGISMKRTFEVQSCFEEFSIRIFNAFPEAKISVQVIYGEAISARLTWPGSKYNPLKIQPDEDEIDVMSLKIIKHRALRASYTYSDNINKVHVVI